jgi:hypothetical protein
MNTSLGHDLDRRDPEQQHGGVPVEEAAASYRRVVEAYQKRLAEEKAKESE